MSANLSTPARSAPDSTANRSAGLTTHKVAHAAINLAVFALLGGILYLGHHTGWKMPKFSLLTGQAGAPADDWCSEHLVPESTCVECKVDLLPKQKEYGFCRDHGVAECVTCHPELAQVATKPKLPQYDTAQALALMSRTENNSRNLLHKRRVQFASGESADKMGIEVDVVQERPMTDVVTANGQLMFDPRRVAHLSARVGGSVASVLKTVGDPIAAGEIVCLVDAAQVGQAKSHLLHSIVQLQLKSKTVKQLRSISSAIPGRTILEAETAFEESEIEFISARQALVNLGFEVPDELEKVDAKKISDDLRFLGIPESLLDSLPVGTKTANLIPVRAPFQGVVVEAEAVAGEVVDSTELLFTVANPVQMWLMLYVKQEDAKHISVGLPVLFKTDDSGEEVAGTISWLSPGIDEKTRTMQVRVHLDNLSGRLRDKTFGTGQIVLRKEANAVVVPKEAIQTTSDANFVFVRDKDYLKPDAPKVFHVRQVRIGARDGRNVELLAGVLPGEVVATKGSPILFAQLMRSSLGAGCGCHDK